jgi:hypothetical protein
MLSELPEGIVIIFTHACLGMLSVHVDHTSGKQASRYAIAVDPNFVMSVVFRITSCCRGTLQCGRSTCLFTIIRIHRSTRWRPQTYAEYPIEAMDYRHHDEDNGANQQKP